MVEATAAVPGRRFVTTGLLMAMAVVATEVTVVTTALPTVVGELCGIDLYPWVFSAYLLTSTRTVPIFGKLADVYGRKPIFVGGVAIFLLGVGAMRTGQQYAVAGRLPVVTGTGCWCGNSDCRHDHRRRLPTGGTWLNSGHAERPLGVASLAGPGLGAYPTINYSWRYVFFVSVPFGALAASLIAGFLRERLDRRPVRVDLVGALALSSGLLCQLMVALEGSRTLPWDSPALILLFLARCGLLTLFIPLERRAADPILPLHLFRQWILAVAPVANSIQGAQLFALTAYIPLNVQGVRGESAAGAGAALTPLLLG